MDEEEATSAPADPGEVPRPLTFRNVALVIGGYAIAVLLASGAVALRAAHTSGPDAQASSGMYAFGDAVIWVCVFGLCALIPTGFLLFLLRPHRRFWVVFSTIAVGIGVTSIIAAIIYVTGRAQVGTTLGNLAQFSVLRILLTPLLAITFLVCAVVSSWRGPRMALLIAALMEMVTAIWIGGLWVLGAR